MDVRIRVAGYPRLVIDVWIGNDDELDALPESAEVRLDDGQKALGIVADLFINTNP